MLKPPPGTDTKPPIRFCDPAKERGGSSGAEKSELSKVDIDTHSSKYAIASSVRRFEISFLSLLLCNQTMLM